MIKFKKSPPVSADTVPHPVPPDERPAVVEARAVLAKAEAERDRLAAEVDAARRAIADAEAASAEDLLARLARGEAGDAEDGALQAALTAAETRQRRAAAAAQLAGIRLAEARQAAVVAFVGELRPALLAAAERVAGAALEAAAANAELRALVAYAASAGAPWAPHEGQFPLPPPARIAELLAEARRAFDLPLSPVCPPGRTRVRLTERHGSINAGECAALPDAEVVLLVKSGNAELVDPAADERRLGLHKVLVFEHPVRVKFNEVFVDKAGRIFNPGDVRELDPASAARACNFGAAEVAV